MFKLIPQQADFVRSQARHPAYVGAWGTGKSAALIMRAMMLSEDNPGNLGVIFRKEYVDLRDSTLRDFERYTGIKVNSERAAILPNGSEIFFRHVEEMNNIQNMNLGWFAIEQAEELDSDEIFFKLHGRLRREGASRTGFIVANTNGHNWVYKLWKARHEVDYPLFEATSFDAADYLPADTISNWKKLEAIKPKIYKRFVLNSWEESDAADVIIQPELVRKAASRSIDLRRPTRRLVSIDVARKGNDKTVFYALEADSKNVVVLGVESHEKKMTMETVGLAQIFAKKHGDINSYAVDEIGVGGGVADRLKELDRHVIFVNAAERANVREGCYNRRAEIYVTAVERFEAGTIKLLQADTDGNEQLSWTKYHQVKSSGIYQIEPKDDVKARYGESPDFADALLAGIWAIPQAKIYTPADKYAPKARKIGTGAYAILG